MHADPVGEAQVVVTALQSPLSQALLLPCAHATWASPRGIGASPGSFGVQLKVLSRQNEVLAQSSSVAQLPLVAGAHDALFFAHAPDRHTEAALSAVHGPTPFGRPQ